MTTETKSRLMLTILVLLGMSPAIYFMTAGMPLYGSLLLIGGVVLLILIWFYRRR